MQEILEEITNWEDRDDQYLKQKVKPELAKVFKKYERMEESDAVVKATVKSYEVKNQAQNNLKKALEQGENVTKLEEESNILVNEAGAFEKNTKDIKKAACWEHWKWRLIIGFVCLAVLWFIYVQFFSRPANVVPVAATTTK